MGLQQEAASLCPSRPLVHLNLLTICEVGGSVPAPQFYSQKKRGLERLRAVLPGEIPNSLGGKIYA